MASRGINKVILVGNLGQDPEFRVSQNGMGMANISIATSDSWKDKNTGEMRERTEWHRVVLFGKLAEIANEYLKKGSQVYIEGQLQTRKWQDQQGQDRYSTEVVVNPIGGVMQMLGGRNQTSDMSNNNSNFGGFNNSTKPTSQASAQPVKSNFTPEPPMDFDDDIPF